jgi:peptidoglycan/LPS O-acetylase OafA/YrhL
VEIRQVASAVGWGNLLLATPSLFRVVLGGQGRADRVLLTVVATLAVLAVLAVVAWRYERWRLRRVIRRDTRSAPGWHGASAGRCIELASA